ncbi:MAG: GntR family transcriptional regulator [Pirellulales bacterium]|nr:GntR family transcriptional regulator [Pirellulales bacterium]
MSLQHADPRTRIETPTFLQRQSIRHNNLSTPRTPGTDQVAEKPRYRLIYDSLRSQIEGGGLRAGAKLPTEAQLMRQFAVSRTTVSRALRDLEIQGFLTRRRGSGTYVCATASVAEHLELAFFVPWVESGAGLPYVEGLIHQYLADLTSTRRSTLSLQCLAGGATLEERVMASVDALVERGVDGVFYYPAELPREEMQLNVRAVEKLLRSGSRIVLIDRDIVPYPGRSNYTRIGYDNRRGSALLTSHLLDQGARRIAFVGIPEVSTAVADRLAGYHEAHRLHGLTVDSELVFAADEIDLTRDFCDRILDDGRPDAIICKMDRYAALLGRHLMAHGLRIGVDVRLAGFDDDPIAELLPVPLTTIRLPIQPFVHAAYEAMAAQITGTDREPRQIVIDAELVVRGSTCSAPQPRMPRPQFESPLR